jgi:predicted anti-sigma-YlaC factor YlaD
MRQRPKAPRPKIRRSALAVPLGLAASIAAACVLSSCAILGAASKIDDVLMGEEDPAIAGGALPTMIVASEALSEADPKNQGKAVTTASLYVMYANAFVQGPASALPDSRFEERQAAFVRAGALYRRAFRLLSSTLDRRLPGFVEAAVDGKADMSRLKRSDVPLLYWTSASVLAAFGLNPLDFASARYLGAASAFMARAAELDPGWNKGAIYELYLPYYASMPDYLGGDKAKALDAYEKALSYSKGTSAGLFVAYATSICVPADDYAGYKAALERALSIDPASLPESRLATVIAQADARRLLAGAADYFILPEGEPTP